MIKGILRFLRLIVVIYLLLLVLIYGYYYCTQAFSDNVYPSIKGYSYFKVYNNYLEPEIKDGSIVILKYTELLKEGDFVAFEENGLLKIKKIEEITEDSNLKLNYTNYKEESAISTDGVLGKVIYNNEKFTKVINILTNTFTLIAMVVFIIIVPEATYKR